MGLIPEQYVLVREAAWWGGVALDEAPSLREAMVMAGHDWTVARRPVAHYRRNAEGVLVPQKLEGYTEHFRSDNGFTLGVHADTFEPINNHVAYDFAEILLEDPKFDGEVETAGSMDGGKQNFLTLKLRQPFYITGDESAILPYIAFSWCHDGSGSLKSRSTSVRQVCQNTVSISEAEGKRLGTDFTFRHTKNVRERIEKAKEIFASASKGWEEYRKVMEELASIEVTPAQRDLFVSTIIGDVRKDGVVVSRSAATTDRVKNNIEAERAKILALFGGQTIPEKHSLTAYGLHLAGVEYFDHLRRFKSRDSYVKRTLLADNPAKAQLIHTIRELTAA